MAACHARWIDSRYRGRTPTGGSIMEVRIAQAKLRPIVAAAALPTALLGLALTFVSSPAAAQQWTPEQRAACEPDRKSTRLNSSHLGISYAVFCLKKKNNIKSP